MADSTNSFCVFMMFVNQAVENWGMHLFLLWPNFIL